MEISVQLKKTTSKKKRRPLSKNNGRYRKTTAVIAKRCLKMKNNAGNAKTTSDTRKQRFWAKTTPNFNFRVPMRHFDGAKKHHRVTSRIIETYEVVVFEHINKLREGKNEINHTCDRHGPRWKTRRRCFSWKRRHRVLLNQRDGHHYNKTTINQWHERVDQGKIYRLVLR